MSIDVFMQALGWIGHMLFAVSAVPQAYLSFKQGHSRGISRGLLTMWFGGEAIAIIYGIYESVPTPLMVNYIINFLCLLVIIRYYIWPKQWPAYTEEDIDNFLKENEELFDKLSEDN